MNDTTPVLRPLDLPLGEDVVVLERAETGLIALAKPAGLLSHPNSKDDQDRAVLTCAYSFEDECYSWMRADGSTGRLFLLNRLDSATSGVLICALDVRLAKAVKEQFLHKQIGKIYNALVFGVPSVPNQVWRDRLAVKKTAGQIRTRGAGNIPCECRMHLLGRRAGGGSAAFSLVQLEPRTGRSHQLRVQCAMRKLPIVGDLTYGDFGGNRSFAKEFGTKRLFLHSLETSFDYEYQGKPHHFSAKAPLPDIFHKLLRA